VEEAGLAPVVEEIHPDHVLPNEMSDGNDSSSITGSEGDPAALSSSETETASDDEEHPRQQVTRRGRVVRDCFTSTLPYVNTG
jgi:hypothetical protein